MRRLIVVLFFLIISVWFGIAVMKHPGFLLIVYKPWTIQMPLWFALISLFICFALFYLIIDLIDRMHFIVYRIKNWLQFRREHRAYSKTQDGLSCLIEGRFAKAERLLLAGVNQSVEPLMNYLGAARSAQEQQAYDRRDAYIKKAYEVAPNAILAIGLTQAELELEHDQLADAAATLTKLQQKTPRHPRVLRLLEKVYVRMSDWDNLLQILPSLRKAKVLNSEQAEQFEKNLYCEILHGAQYKNLEEVQKIWYQIPRKFRKHPEVVLAYCKQLLRLDDTQEVEDLIRYTLKYHWQPELVRMYGTLPFANINKQLVVAGAWLKQYGQKPEILLTLGRLCIRNKLWGKAKDYLESCLELAPDAEASTEYQKLIVQFGREEESMQKYREGLDLI